MLPIGKAFAPFRLLLIVGFKALSHFFPRRSVRPAAGPLHHCYRRTVRQQRARPPCPPSPLLPPPLRPPTRPLSLSPSLPPPPHPPPRGHCAVRRCIRPPTPHHRATRRIPRRLDTCC